MIPYGLFSQLFLLILSGALIFTYIKPTLTEIDSTQDTIETYTQEIEKVNTVNQKLNTLHASQLATPKERLDKLRFYMPDSVDTIQVPRDLFAIATAAGVIIKDIEYSGSTKDQAVDVLSDPALLDPSGSATSVQVVEGHTFSLSVEGAYSQVKTLFALMEENHYPLEVVELNINGTEGGFLTVDAEIMTYDSYMPIEADDVVQ